jgi:hypothetical protein
MKYTLVKSCNSKKEADLCAKHLKSILKRKGKEVGIRIVQHSGTYDVYIIPESTGYNAVPVNPIAKKKNPEIDEESYKQKTIMEHPEFLEID